jgi:hypothetical protein
MKMELTIFKIVGACFARLHVWISYLIWLVIKGSDDHRSPLRIGL